MFAFKKYHIFKNVKPSLHVNKDKMDPLANLNGIDIKKIDNVINEFFITLKGCNLYTAIKHINEVEGLSKREREWLIGYVKRENEVNKLDINPEKCSICKKMSLSEIYCTTCIRDKLKDDFKNWTSGNQGIDNFINDVQMMTKAPDKIFEWIPYEEFENIKYKCHGGFGKIYTADWINGSISHWDCKSRSFCRIGTENVILKSLNGSENLDKDLEHHPFFKEIQTHFYLLMQSDRLSWCLGVTKDNKTNDYMMVMSNKKSGDLGKYIINHPKSLTWKNKFHILADLAEALIIIHSKNNAHKDLHPGNILLEDDCNGCHLADFGLCGPVIKNEEHIYGVIPYVAPETLTSKSGYTIKSDIYALGIVMWVLVTDTLPYLDEEYNEFLCQRIITKQARLSDVKGIPEEYNVLMERCRSFNPDDRPNAEEVYRYAKSLLNLMYNNVLKLEDVFKPIVVETNDKKGGKKVKVDENTISRKTMSMPYSKSTVMNFLDKS